MPVRRVTARSVSRIDMIGGDGDTVSSVFLLYDMRSFGIIGSVAPDLVRNTCAYVSHFVTLLSL